MPLPNGPIATDSGSNRVSVDLEDLERERHLRGWSKSELAEQAGIQASTLSEVYRSKSATGVTFAKLVAAFERTPPSEIAMRLLAEPTEGAA